MRVLVVYYSLEGNTKLLSKKIAETINADIIELETSKHYPSGGLKKYVWGGRSAVFGEEPELINEPIDFTSYDTIIIGTPVWASTYAPPFKTLFGKYKIEGKRIALFICHAGGGAGKCIKKIKDALPGNEFIGEIDFVEPKRKPEESCERAAKWASGLNI